MKNAYYMISAKCDVCNQTVLHIVTKDYEETEENVDYVIYRDLCLHCWHTNEPVPTTQCRTTKQGWLEFIQSSLN